MNKQTKKNKRTKRKNKTMKYYGGENPQVPNQVLPPFPTPIPKQVLPPPPPLNNTVNKETIAGIAGNAAIRYAGNTFDYLTKKVMDHSTKSSTEATDTSNNTTPSLISTAMNVVDKVSGAVVSQVNEVLKNPLLQKGVKERLEETTEIIKDFNEEVSTPEAKEELKKAVGNLAVVTDIVLDKMDEPIDKAIDKIGESGQKIMSAAAVGALNAATDAVAIAPGVGALIEIPKLATDLANSASKITGAVSEGSETVKDLVNTVQDAVQTAKEEVDERKEALNATTNIVDEKKFIGGGVNKLNQQQIIGRQIGGRIKKSILEFENPLQNKNKIGGYKTRRKFYKNKRSSTNKRVNVSI